MRVVVWNAHWNTLGGGEVYAGYLAGYLAQSGFEVVLVGVGENPITDLQKRLGSNLQGISYTKVPNETYLLALLRSDDFFVNGSFGSTFPSPVKRSVYICHFPVTSRKRRIFAKFFRNNKNLVISSNLSILHPVNDCVLLVGEGLAYFFDDQKMTIEVEFGRVELYKDFELKKTLDSKEQFRLESKGYYSIKSISDVVPVTVVSGVSYLSWMRKFFVRRLTYQENFASSYSQIWANSIFTSGFIFKYWKKKSRLIFPPHSERHFSSTTRNSYDILSIGRFMNPQDGHCKNQLKLVEAFEKLASKSSLPWKLHLAGGVDIADDRYFKKVSDLVKSKGLNVNLYPNCLQSDLDYLLQSSQFYWHATGMGVTRNRPEDMEHFGIAIVEALNAGLIPIVYDVAGPAEILRDYPLHRFSSIKDLVNKTLTLSESNSFELREKFKETTMKYNNTNFQSRVDAALSDLGFILDKKRS